MKTKNQSSLGLDTVLTPTKPWRERLCHVLLRKFTPSTDAYFALVVELAGYFLPVKTPLKTSSGGLPATAATPSPR